MTPVMFASWQELSSGAPWVFEHPRLLWLALPLFLLPVLFLPGGRRPLERARNLVSALLRGLTLALLALAAAQPGLSVPEPDLGVSVIVDRSLSMRGSRGEDAEAQAQARLDALPEPVRRALVRLESEAALPTLLAQAAALTPRARTRRALLLSDGAWPLRDGEALLSAAREAGVQLFPIPPGLPALNVGLKSLDLPLKGRAGAPVPLRLELYASEPSAATLRLTLNGRPWLERELSLSAGPQALSFELPPVAAGTHKVLATLSAEGDLWPEDDSQEGWVMAQGEGPVLFYGPGAPALSDKARSAGLDARALKAWPEELPDGAALFLLSPDLESWPPGRAAALASAVREGGLDLVITGGREGLSADAESLAPLARALPAVLPRKRDREPPPLAVVYALDSSASMSRENKLPLALGAIQSSVTMLSPEARVGVLSFSDELSWTVPMARARNPEALSAALSQISPQGGTRIYLALEEALDAAQATDAALKHVVLLSDGASMDSGGQHHQLLARLRASDVTVSTVALSAEAATEELLRIAEAGHGRAWRAEQLADLPRIFVDETLLMLRRNITEGEEQVKAVPGSKLSAGVDWAQVPRLGGWNRARARGSAELGLFIGRTDQPLLLSWRYGLGSGTLFLSQLSEGWGAAWGDWPGLGPWMKTLVSALRQRPLEDRVRLTLRPEPEALWVSATVVDPLSNLQEGGQGSAQVRGAVGTRSLPLPERAPGVYEAQIPWDGALLLTLSFTSAQGSPVVVRAQAAPPPPEELRGALLDLEGLSRLAQASGGVLLPSPAAFASEGVKDREEARLIWPWALLAALGGLVLELGVRSLRVRR